MKPTVLVAAVFAASCVALGAWLLSRSRAPDAEAPAQEAPTADAFAFAEWSAHSDAILLVDVEPEGARFVPKQFHVLDVVTAEPSGLTTTHGAFFSWAPADRAQSKMVLMGRGFAMTDDDHQPYPVGLDPLIGEVAAGDAGTEQTVLLRSRGGLTAVLRRERGAARSSLVWGRRATGFPDGDGKLAYVVPDKVIVPIESAPPARLGTRP